MAEKVKIGIIGCGGIANGKHLRAISNIDFLEPVAFCDIIEERAIETAKKYGGEMLKFIQTIKNFSRMRALLQFTFVLPTSHTASSQSMLLKQASMFSAKSPWQRHMPKQRQCMRHR